MDKRIAKIVGTMLGFEDHGIVTCLLDMDYGGSRQGVGGYFLSIRRPDERVAGTAYGMTFVIRLLEACGVETWEKLTARTVYVLIDESGRPAGIEPLPTEPGTAFLFDDLKELWEQSRG